MIVESNASRKRALEIKDSIENAKSKIMKLEDQLKKFLFGCRLIKVFVEVRVEAEFRYHCLSFYKSIFSKLEEFSQVFVNALKSLCRRYITQKTNKIQNNRFEFCLSPWLSMF